MHQIQSTSGDGAYLKLLDRLVKHGRPTAPRDQATTELLDVTIQVDDPSRLPPLSVRDNFNYYIAATEVVHLLAGASSLEQLNAASGGRFSAYADGGRLLGAYGPRLHGQLDEVERRLVEDPDTRQAVAVIWNRDETISADVPCTVAITFRIRDDRLGMKVHMRSNDAHLGVPYDWFVFSRLHLAMAEVLNRRPGPYVHHVDSLHLYLKDAPRVAKTLIEYEAALNGDPDEAFAPLFTDDADEAQYGATLRFSRDRDAHLVRSHRWQSWDEVRDAAVRTAFHQELPGGLRPSSPLRWYYDHLPSLAPGSVLCTGCRYVVPEEETEVTTLGLPGARISRPLCGRCRAHR